MCKKIMATKIFTCGKRKTEQVKFEACDDQNAPGHTVKEDTLGSTRKREGCGEYSCDVCRG